MYRLQTASTSRNFRLLAACSLLSLAGCTATPNPNTPVRRTLLGSVQLTETHVVRFWELEPGNVLVEESGRLGLDGENSRPAFAVERLQPGATLAEIYLSLRPGTPESAVLTKLRAADRRIARQAHKATRRTAREDLPVVARPDGITMGVNGPDMLRPVADLASPEPVQLASLANPELPKPLSHHEWDWIADASWFVQNFCNAGQFKWCATNVTWAHSAAIESGWFQSWGFAAGFHATARYYGKYRSCGGWGPWYDCSWKTAFDEPIQPRFLRGYYWTSNGKRYVNIDGNQPAPHIGLAVMWNASNISNPGPAKCGGHNEFTCNGACNPGLSLFNGACWACGVAGLSCCTDISLPDPGGWSGSCIQGMCSYPGGFCT